MALTRKQELFVQEVIRTGNQRQSYKTAYPNARMSDANIDSKAWHMLNDEGKVRSRYQELLDETEKVREEEQRKNIKTRLDREEFLSQVIDNNEEKMADRLKALDILNRMCGDYTEKINLEGSVPIVLTGYDDVED